MKANSRSFAVAMLASAFATMAGAQELGRVHFDTSCSSAAQDKFDRGLAMVHSFVYLSRQCPGLYRGRCR